jgi:predicted amidophosphoribosyltransferase
VGLDRAARARNVRGAFRVERPDGVRDRAVLLVDDVITTGATAEACARALRKAGAARVHVWAVARQGDDRPASGSA